MPTLLRTQREAARGNRYPVTVIGHLHKSAAACAVLDRIVATVAKTLLIRWTAEGCRWAKSILSEKGGEFVKVTEELTSITWIEHITTKGYNPWENGITERLNGTIVSMLTQSSVDGVRR